MDKNVKKKDGRSSRSRQRRSLRIGTLAALVALGIGAMAGMALLNANARPNRDMKWYVHTDRVEVAAPPVGEGYDDSVASVSSTARRGADILAGRRADQTDGPATADLATDPTQQASEVPTENPTDAPTDIPTQAPLQTPEAAPVGAQTADTAPAEQDDPTPAGAVTLTITAAGDCTFGGELGSKGRRRFLDLAETYGNDYFFQNVRHLFQADDLTIVNLEGPLTGVTTPGKHGGFIFKGDPSYAGILSGSGVELCNLANNHSLDYGKAGLKETIATLQQNGIGTCGFSTVFDSTIKGVRVRALGFEWWGSDKKTIAQAVRQAREGCDLLIVNMHWGQEGHRQQSAKQQSIGHAIIDAGADLVIGTHPHVYQGIEKYKGKYIVYSLGNFCFAGNANPHDKRCLIFQQTFSFNPGMGITQANIMDAGINVIPCSISSVQDKNDFQPVILPAEEGGELLKAVAANSTSFSLNGSLWMPGNYMESYGLLQQQPATADIAPEEADPLAGSAPEAAADAPTQEDAA